MDKFGIFKLLNSFYDFYQKSQSEKNDNIGGQPTQNQPNDLLNSLFKKKQESPPPQRNAPPKKTPLQSTMLSTMTSHDQFVKRVTKNTTKTT